MTKPNKKAVAESAAPQPATQAPQTEELTPVRAIVILIEAVDKAQQAGGVYSLEDAALLAACKKIVIGAIQPPKTETGETVAPVQPEA